MAIGIGRAVRFTALGLLAVRYGARAQTYLAEQGATVSLEVVAVLTVGFVAYLLWRKARARKSR
jgi:hypothetical protein